MRKKWLVILIPVISLALLTAFIIIVRLNPEGKSISDELKLSFANNYISYVLEDDETMSFNLFGAQDVLNGDPSLLQSIDFIETNNPNIEVIDFSIDSGIIHKDHQLINIMIEFQLLSDELEHANELIIHYADDKKQKFEVGDINLQNSGLFTTEDISPKGDFTVGYPTPSLDVNLLNNSDETIQINKVSDLIDNLSHAFNSQELFLPNELKHMSVVFDDKTNLENIDFYTITPILEYSINEGEYFYNMPGVMYGIFIPDEEKVERIIH